MKQAISGGSRGVRKELVPALAGWIALGSAAAALMSGCGSGFSACEENRSCADGAGGSGGSNVEAGAPTAESGTSNGNGGTSSHPEAGSPSKGGGGTGAIAEGGAPTSTDGGEPSGAGTGGDAGASGNAGSGGNAGAGGNVGMGGNGGSGGNAGNGSNGGTAGNAGTGGTGPVVDKTPPTVVSVTPANDAKGVAANSAITVTWSEPMDKATAQASFQSADLAGKVTFEWPSATVMKVVPVSPLVYATGNHPQLATIAAKVYSLTLNTSAKDQAGNALAAAYPLKFSTLRRVTWSDLAYNTEMLALNSDNTVKQLNYDAGIFVGDWDDDTWSRMALQFDLTTIPADAVGIASAYINIYTQGAKSPNGLTIGNPFTAFGGLLVEHIQTAKVDSTTLLLAPLRSLGTLTNTTAAGDKTLDVTVAAADDFAKRAARANRSQYRLQFAVTTNTNKKIDAVNVSYDSNAALAADYLIP